jgi:HSP20 family protein
MQWPGKRKGPPRFDLQRHHFILQQGPPSLPRALSEGSFRKCLQDRYFRRPVEFGTSVAIPQAAPQWDRNENRKPPRQQRDQEEATMTLVRNGNRLAVTPWNLGRELDALSGNLWPEQSAAFAPSMEVRETEDAYILEADVPGIPREAIDITIEDNRVTIKGERKAEEVKEAKGYHRSERRYGAFERSFTVKDGFDGEKVEARVEHGVLRLTLPKRAEQKPRRIEVKVN